MNYDWRGRRIGRKSSAACAYWRRSRNCDDAPRALTSDEYGLLHLSPGKRAHGHAPMTSKEEIRKRRDGAIFATLGIEGGDRIFDVVSRDDGRYMISLEKIIRINLPDDIDPEMEHENAPIAQTLIVGKGSRNPIVARTILQAKDFSTFISDKNAQKGILDIAWEVMQSLLALDRTIEWLSNSIDEMKSQVSENYAYYVSGPSPPPPPIIDGLEVEFRLAVLVANHALNAISEAFTVLFGKEFKVGRFDLILAWSTEKFGTDDILTAILKSDHRWINLWGEVRNAFEHPRKDYYVKVNNFRILPDRQLQLPTWQMKHPKFESVFRPQNMIETLTIHRDNILGFFENMLLLLTDKIMHLPMPIEVIDLKETDRNPDCPKRYKIGVL